MNTLILDAQHSNDITLAGQLLRRGKLVAVPTETVYGLAADASQPDAVSAIFAAKGRPADHPLIVHLHSTKAMTDWACDIPDSAWQLARAFWPGPLTLLLKKANHVSNIITGGLDSIGLRMPAHPALLSLLRQHELAVAAPSANRYKKLSPTSCEQVLASLQGRIAAVLDGGFCQHGVESTIVDLTGDTPTIVRAGPVKASQLAAILQREVAQPAQHQVKVAGNVEAHYQPEAPLICLDSKQLAESIGNATADIAVLHYSPLPQACKVQSMPMAQNAADYASALYRSLYLADKAGVSQIWCELPPQSEDWLAVHDRLRRAGFNANS